MNNSMTPHEQITQIRDEMAAHVLAWSGYDYSHGMLVRSTEMASWVESLSVLLTRLRAENESLLRQIADPPQPPQEPEP